MVKNKYEIIRLNKKHINGIEMIWNESLPENLKSMIGNYIITNYLKNFFDSELNLGIGVIKSKKLLGFVLFGRDDKVLGKLMQEKFLSIIRSFICSIIYFEFKKIKNFIDCLIFILLSKNFENKLRKNCTELLIICINKKFQNKGLGTFLIVKGLKKYENFFKKYKNIFVKTLKKDHNNVFFYKKNKFKYTSHIFGRIYLKR